MKVTQFFSNEHEPHIAAELIKKEIDKKGYCTVEEAYSIFKNFQCLNGTGKDFEGWTRLDDSDIDICENRLILPDTVKLDHPVFGKFGDNINVVRTVNNLYEKVEDRILKYGEEFREEFFNTVMLDIFNCLFQMGVHKSMTNASEFLVLLYTECWEAIESIRTAYEFRTRERFPWNKQDFYNHCLDILQKML